MIRMLRQFNKTYYLAILTISILLFLFIKCKLSQIGNFSTANKSLRQTRTNIRPLKLKLECYIFLMIMTSPKGGELRRKAMRETWLTTTKVNTMTIAHKFIIGTAGLSSITSKTLQEEHLNYNDLLFLEDFKDSYYKLTEKLLRTFVWINENISSKYVMKVDDDTFVRLNKLVPSIDSRLQLGKIYWGFFRGNSNVKKSGPWKEEKWFLSDHYLPYALGGGYLITSDLIPYIAMNANYFSVYNSEDISLGVWLSSIKINRIHDIRFDTEYKSKGCSNVHVVSHKQLPEDMYAKHNQLVHHDRLCKVEIEIMLTYDYNWKEPPSRCCKRVSIKQLSSAN